MTSTLHIKTQLMLADLGRRLGFDIWIAKNDRHREYEGSRLGQLDGVLDKLPAITNNSTGQRVVGLIDVIWLRGNDCVAAFEIECSTKIYSGILRMTDLVVMLPNLSIPMYIVAPGVRRSRVAQEIMRPTFSSGLRRPLHLTCRYLDISIIESIHSYPPPVLKAMHHDTRIIETSSESAEMIVLEEGGVQILADEEDDVADKTQSSPPIKEISTKVAIKERKPTRKLKEKNKRRNSATERNVREKLVRHFENEWGVQLLPVAGRRTFFVDENAKKVLHVLPSRRYEDNAQSSYYWYGLKSEIQNYVSGGYDAVVAFGMDDLASGLAVPAKEVLSITERLILSRKPDGSLKHWHVRIRKNAEGWQIFRTATNSNPVFTFKEGLLRLAPESPQPIVNHRSFSFSSVGIPLGSVLVFVADPAKVAKVQSDSHVLYEGEVMSLSSAAVKARNQCGQSWTRAQGPREWLWDGKRISELS